jgi:hypothetical protein
VVQGLTANTNTRRSVFPVSEHFGDLIGLLAAEIEVHEDEDRKADLIAVQWAIERLPHAVPCGRLLVSVGKSCQGSHDSNLTNSWVELEMTPFVLECRIGGHVYEQGLGGDSFSNVVFSCDSTGQQKGDLAHWVQHLENHIDGSILVSVHDFKAPSSPPSAETREEVVAWFDDWDLPAPLNVRLEAIRAAVDLPCFENALNFTLADTIGRRKKLRDEATTLMVFGGGLGLAAIAGWWFDVAALALLITIVAGFLLLAALTRWERGLELEHALQQLRERLRQQSLGLRWPKEDRYPTVEAPSARNPRFQKLYSA